MKIIEVLRKDEVHPDISSINEPHINEPHVCVTYREKGTENTYSLVIVATDINSLVAHIRNDMKSNQKIVLEEIEIDI